MIVLLNYLKILKIIDYYWKWKEKKMCKVNDNLVILIIESIILEVFFLLILK